MKINMTMWAIKNGYFVFTDTIRKTRREAIDYYRQYEPSRSGWMPWKYYYRKGYRAIKIEIKEVK